MSALKIRFIFSTSNCCSFIHVCGISGILKSVLVDTCCLGCTKVTYHPYDGYKLIYDAIIPRENGLNSETYYGYPYTTLSQLKTVTFFGKNKKHEPVNLISELFKSIGKTWSLLVVALSMAVCSGTLIWIMVGVNCLY